MKKSEAAGLAFAAAAASLGVVALVKAQQGCQPPSGGCPPGETFDYQGCQCVPSGGGTYDVSFLVEGPNGPLSGAVGLLGSTPAYSDSNGDMSFSGVAAGTYLFVCSATGYVDVSEQVTVSASQTSFTVDMKLCAPPSGGCRCGSTFSGSACVCVPQTPAVISIESSMPFTQNWFMAADVFYRTFKAGTLEGACPGGCQGPPSSYATTLAVPVSGTVLDANGDPVCGVPVSASLGTLASSEWTVDVAGYPWTGYFTYGLRSQSTTTAADGTFSFEVDVTIHVNQPVTVNPGCVNCACVGTLSQSFPIALYATVSPSVKSVTSLSMNSAICGYGVD